MNKQKFLEYFTSWRAKNGYPKRQACRDIYKQYLTAEYMDSEEFEWCYYISKQDKPSMFLDSLFVKGSEVTKNDPINSTNNRPKEDDIKQEIIDIFYNFVKENNFIPEFKDLNYNSNIKKYFKTEKELYNACSEKYNLSEFSLNESLFTDKYFENVLDKVSKHKRFVITTAVVGKKVDKEFINSIKNYCNRNNALCLVMPCQDTFNRKSGFEYQLDPELKDFCIVYKDLYLNKNIYLSNIKVSAKMINPVTGLNRLAVDSSVILASPKLFLDYIPNQNSKQPHAIMTTGACTINDYNNDLYMSHRLSKISEEDHSISAIVIEIQDNEIFHFRQLEKGLNGINDFGVKYCSDGSIENLSNIDLVMGDLHSSEINEEVFNAHKDLMSLLNINNVILHDIITMEAISHHNKNKTITNAILDSQDKLCLSDEAELCAQKIWELLDLCSGEIDIVYSNHHNFLSRYIEDGRYAFDSRNLYYSLDLVKAFLNGIDPFKEMLSNKTSLVNLSDSEYDRIKFLEKLECKERNSVEISNHGSYGQNGSKGNPKIYRKAFKKSISGHIHYGSIYNQAWTVGTCGILDPIYVSGLSSWTHTSCLIYKNGTRQLINFIKNEDGNYTWRL